MNVLLIYPEWPDTYWSFKHALPIEGKRSAYPPLGLLTIAPLLPQHWEKRLVDINVRPLLDADLEWADLALLSGMLVHKAHLLQILARCRAGIAHRRRWAHHQQRRGLAGYGASPQAAARRTIATFGTSSEIDHSQDMI